MLENIKAHSMLVAKVAVQTSTLARESGVDIDIPTIQASALLHDIAKSYCIHHGGNHSQLGAAWVMQLTGNPVISMVYSTMSSGPLSLMLKSISFR